MTPFYGSPPWLFVINEVATMFPRACEWSLNLHCLCATVNWKAIFGTVSGHRWYHTKFKDYPKERKAVVPYLL